MIEHAANTRLVQLLGQFPLLPYSGPGRLAELHLHSVSPASETQCLAQILHQQHQVQCAHLQQITPRKTGRPGNLRCSSLPVQDRVRTSELGKLALPQNRSSLRSPAALLATATAVYCEHGATMLRADAIVRLSIPHESGALSCS